MSRPISGERAARPLYEPFGFLVVRTPCLPIEFYLDLTKQTSGASDEEADRAIRECVSQSSDIGLAIAVASRSLWDSLAREALGRRATQRRRALLRYLIRMSTRPTPFGMFAGVGVAAFG